MLIKYFNLIKQEVVGILGKKFDADMADMLSEGIIKQFPVNFEKRRGIENWREKGI